MAALPVFEPHYQVLISKGVVPSGTITVKTREPKPKSCTALGESIAPTASPTSTFQTTTTVYDLTNSTVYLEKNWGGSFPSRWWWIQANTFRESATSTNNGNEQTGHTIDLCVTSTGAMRRVPLLEQEEAVALIGLHWDGEFLPFPTVDWDVRWGRWKIAGSYGDYGVELIGTCNVETEPGVPVRCPTDSGMEEIAHETFHGNLRVKLYKRVPSPDAVGGSKQLVLDATTGDACLEIGGKPWETEPTWRGESAMTEPIKSIAMNVDLERSVSDVLQQVSRFVEIPGL